jgi:recombination protein RecA
VATKKEPDTDGKKRKLELTISALQDRWGVQAIRQASETAAVPHLPTGFALLDKALGLGGLPLGRISEISGVPTSGMATITLKTIAGAQAAGGTAVYVDLNRTFDPDYAARCGLALNQLLLVRPYDTRQGLLILQDFVLGGGMRVLVFDTSLPSITEPGPAQALSRALDRIIAPLGQTRCALLFLVSLPAGARASLARIDGYPANAVLPFYASVRLFVQRERWLYRRHDISGYRARVHIVKNKLGPSGKQISIAITLNGTVAGPVDGADQGI